MQVSTKIREMEDRNSDTKDGREKRIYLSKNILIYKIPGTKHPDIRDTKKTPNQILGIEKGKTHRVVIWKIFSTKS